MSDINSLQGCSDISLFDQKNTVTYKVCRRCNPKVVYMCFCDCDKPKPCRKRLLKKQFLSH